MKRKIILFLFVIISFSGIAQVQIPQEYSIKKPLQLQTVDHGSKSDSVLVRGADKIVKFIPRSEFSTGADSGKENISNKTNIISGQEASTTLYPSVKGVADWLTTAKIKSILGISTLSGSNTGDQDLSAYAPKASPAFTGVPSAPTAPAGATGNQIATLDFVLANSGSVTSTPHAAVCFTFDDSFASQIPLASAFEARSVRFSQAVTINYLGTAGKMTLAQVLNLQSRGFEVLNHGQAHLDMRDSGTATFADAYNEINGGHSNFVGLGLIPKGFVAPNSAIKREFMPIINNLYNNAYTIYQGTYAGAANPDIQVMNSPIYATLMNRASLYQHTVAECKAMIDRAVATNGVVTFYDHDPGGAYYPTSASLADIMEVVDYAISAVGASNVIKASEIPARFNAVKTGGTLFTEILSSLTLSNNTFTTAQIASGVESKDVKAEADGTFTIKESGIYNVEIGIMLTGATATRVVTGLEIDGTGIYRNRHNGFGSIGGTSAQSYSGFGYSSLTLVKGQKIKVKIFQDSGSSKTILGGEAYNFIKIIRIN
ncbi:DUF2334 domain-containing protein [Flavobacterium mesophilum]|uniref:DUF2334 domain-containing protein n=1 Tax=Flavobacterium mesophilum TaxID=3143495 RepID=UPI0031D0C87F